MYPEKLIEPFVKAATEGSTRRKVLLLQMGKRVEFVSGWILPMNQDYFILYTEEDFQLHTRKIEE